MKIRSVSFSNVENYKEKKVMYLVKDNWNDFGYQTLYTCYFFNEDSQKTENVGTLSITGIEETPQQFGYNYCYNNVTSDDFELRETKKIISLGDKSYYKYLNDNYSLEERIEFYNRLNDIAYHEDQYEKYKNLDVVKKSFFRAIKHYEFLNEYVPLAKSSFEKSHYHFSYCDPSYGYNIEFESNPKDVLPTNIHAIIGNNGSGKTKILEGLCKAFIKMLDNDSDKNSEYFKFINGGKNTLMPFESLIFFSLTPFDNYDPDLRVTTYLRDIDTNDDNPENNVGTLNRQIEIRLNNLLTEKNIYGSQKKVKKFEEVLCELETNFKFNCDISNFIPEYDYEKGQYIINEEIINQTLIHLSSGQKIILLSLGIVINRVVENTLLLIDEPELFLHPPLITGYIRVLSKILKEKNGFCILATHSPIILQEIPDTCVNIIEITGEKQRNISNPSISTFGENLSILNNYVFGRSIKETGYYVFLESLVENDRAKAVKLKDNRHLGTEAIGHLLTFLERSDYN